MRKRANFAGGLIANDPLTDTALTANSEGFVVLPSVTLGDDYVPIVLDPDGSGGAPEIAYVSFHGLYSQQVTFADNNAATPAREAKEGSSSREHALGIQWLMGPTIADVEAEYSIDLPKQDSSDFDEDFTGDIIDAKWTVTDGSSGTVDLTGGIAGTYDVESRRGWLLAQPDNSSNVYMRQDVTLGDGESIVMSLAPSISFGSGAVNGGFNLGITLNDNDANPTSETVADRASVFLEALDGVGWSISYFENGSPAASTQNTSVAIERVFLRIARDGTDYWGMWSMDGRSWNVFETEIASATAPDNIWIHLQAASAVVPIPVHSINWIRLGSNNVDPW